MVTKAIPDKLKAAEAAHRKAGLQIRAARKRLGIAATDADRMAAKRASERDLNPPKIKDRARRTQLEADDAEWLRQYMGHVYTKPLTV